MKLYTNRVCNLLAINYEEIIFSFVKYPANNKKWDGVFFIDPSKDGGNKIEISSSFSRPSRRAKIVIIHELLHYKMKHIEVAVRFDIFDNYHIDKKLTKKYENEIENYVEEFSEIIYTILETACQ